MLLFSKLHHANAKLLTYLFYRILIPFKKCNNEASTDLHFIQFLQFNGHGVRSRQEAPIPG